MSIDSIIRDIRKKIKNNKNKEKLEISFYVPIMCGTYILYSKYIIHLGFIYIFHLIFIIVIC